MALSNTFERTAPVSQVSPPSLRILASCGSRHGGNDDSFVRAFRRAGHSVLVVPPENFLPGWETKWLRAVRRLARPSMVSEYNRALVTASKKFKPDLFFVFKGSGVTRATIEGFRARGAVAINFFPDTGFDGCAAQAIAVYDWVFTTKPAHIDFLRTQYCYTNVTFVPHAYDPEVHAVQQMCDRDRRRYECDVVFIGNASRKKEELIAHVISVLPERSFKIWGPDSWQQARTHVRSAYQGTDVWGQEYAKAISGGRINLGLLYEGSPAAPAGDVITARTFEVPAAGGMMLHERTEEAMRYFEDGKECAFFADADDLVAKIRYYLAHEDERLAIAAAGHRRALTSGYSYNDRVVSILARYRELRAARVSEQD